MNDYDNEYYFIERPKQRPELPSLVRDANTEEPTFRFQAMPRDAAPLVFHNGWSDSRRADGIKELAADVLFEGANLVVRNKVREELLDLELPYLSMHSSVFIDKGGAWHKDYWYLRFTMQFDCWDRDNSTFENEPLEIGGMKLFSVYRYSLNSKLLDETPLQQRLLFKMGGTPLTVGGAKLYSVYSYRLDADVLDQVPLEQRLLFKMGGTQDGYIVCHTTMTKHFSSALSKSLVFTRISDY